MSSTPPPGPPPSGGEYLEHGGGQPLTPAASSGGGGKKLALAGVGVVAVLGLVGGGLWAASSYFGTGDQPAQALPAGTLGYVSIDLDPSGEQKLEALRTLQKFPAFESRLNLDTDDDLRQRFAEEAISQSGCDLDYDQQIAPWIGNRFAVAAVDVGEDVPAPVVVAQVTDAGAAEDGLAAIAECGDGETGGFAVEGDWAVLAETDDLADEVVSQAGDSTLADDEDFQSWTDRAGDAGILSAYAAPEAGAALAQGLGDLSDPFSEEGGGDPVPPELLQPLEDFQGAALTVRFADGAVEVESAVDSSVGGLSALSGSDQGAAAMQTLPEDTAAAIGVAFEDGWFTELVGYLSDTTASDVPVDDFLAEAEAQTGLDLPDDAETLLGDSAVLAVSADIDPETFFASADGSDIPVGLKVKGDAEGIEAVLDKVRSQPALAGVGDTFLASDAEGDYVAVSPSTDYRAQLLGDGGLGSSDTFQSVVAEADRASAVLFVNFDAGDGWLQNLAGEDPEVADNLAPLDGLGVSTWTEDEVAHSMLRVTTD